MSGVRFNDFLFDASSGELTLPSGEVVRLRRQLSIALDLLIRRAGEVVTREELRRALWNDRAVVDFDGGLNFCIRRLRAVLRDNAECPRCIETLPKRGYRFIAAVRPSAPVSPSENTDGRASRGSVRFPLWAATTLMGFVAIWAVVTFVGLSGVDDTAEKRVVIAVLPFTDLGGGASDRYVGPGLTDDLITQLGRLAPERLGVVTYSAKHPPSPDPVTFATIGRAASVEYVLTGSVRVSPQDESPGTGEPHPRLFVNTRLVRVTDGTQVWAESFDRTLDDTYEIQREIAQNVTRELAIKLLPAQQNALARATTRSTRAYEAYLRGQDFLKAGTESGFRDAAKSFESALRYDPGFALAQAALAGAYFQVYDYGFESEEVVCSLAAPAAARAIELDDALARSYVWRAVAVATCARDDAAVVRDFERAIDLNPSDVEAHGRYGWYLLSRGNKDAALLQMKAAVKGDPLSPDTHAAVAYTLLALGRTDEALAAASRALQVDPAFPFALYVSSRVYTSAHRYSEAISAMEAARRTSAGGSKYVFSLGMLYARLGRAGEARRMLDELTQIARARYVPPEYLRLLSRRLSS